MRFTPALFLASIGLLVGSASAVASAALVTPLSWTTTGPLISPISDASHPLVSVKDPTIVYHNGKWHVFATTADEHRSWGMEYVSFRTWEEASAAKPFYFDQNPNLRGYHCAPQVFYFRPQKKWYLVYQSQHPTYSTTEDIENPGSWSAPQPFFQGTPATVVEGWLDYWIISDETHVYLFFSDDHGRFYRSRTSREEFPRGFTDPVVVMQEPKAGDLFEASCVYRLKGQNQYLCLIECMGGERGHRYFRAFTSERLDGSWTPLAHANSWATPFAGPMNVQAKDGAKLWSADISHGEMLRDGIDETMTIDPAHLQFLYQGSDPNAVVSDYSQIPYRLALLTAKQ